MNCHSILILESKLMHLNTIAQKIVNSAWKLANQKLPRVFPVELLGKRVNGDKCYCLILIGQIRKMELLSIDMSYFQHIYFQVKMII